MRILVAEDDQKLASFMVKGLKQNSFAVDHSAMARTRSRSRSTRPTTRP